MEAIYTFAIDVLGERIDFQQIAITFNKHIVKAHEHFNRLVDALLCEAHLLRHLDRLLSLDPPRDVDWDSDDR